MQLRNNNRLWGSIAQALHWAMALLIFEQLASGHVMAWLGPGESQDQLFYLTHEPLGVLVLLLLVFRLIWRAANPTPALPEIMPRWQVAASYTSHAGLYIAMIVMISSAWLMASFAGFPESPNAPWTLPNFTEKNLDYGRWSYNVHVWTGWTIIALVTVHAGAAIKHHVVDKDDVLRRMTPKWIGLK